MTGAAQKSSEAPPAPTLQAWVVLGSLLPHPKQQALGSWVPWEGLLLLC